MIKLRSLLEALRPDKKGFVVDVEQATVRNTNFRKVLYTADHQQLVVMTLQPGEEIGEETHPTTDQFFRVEEGTGSVVLNGVPRPIKAGSALIVPAGTRHNVIADKDSAVKLYTIYSPPQHRDGVVHKTKADAEADTTDHFTETTE